MTGTGRSAAQDDDAAQVSTREKPDWSIYSSGRRPTSAGRVLLAAVLEDIMSETTGLRPDGIARTFAADDPAADDERAAIRSYVAFIGGLIQQGELSTWVRPFGGGELATLPAAHWEIDDFEKRFESSAVDPARWAEPDAPPTHWIFVTQTSLEAWWDAWNAGDAAEQGPERLPIVIGRADLTSPAPRSSYGTTFLKVSEVEARTGMSRSTIYSKIASDGFPEPIRLGSRMSRWRDEDVEAWLRVKVGH